MRFFYLGETRELSIIGHYPQTMRTKNVGYNVDAFNSERKVKADIFPDFEPKYGLDLQMGANATDALDKSTLPYGFVVSEKLKKLLMNFMLPPHRFYKIDVYGTDRTYYWFHYITNIWNYIDFENTEIEVIHKFKFEVEEIKTFSSFEEIMTFKKSLPRQNTIRFGSIKLRNNFPNYDLFEMTGPKYYTLISNKLKQRFEEEKITGIGLKEYTKIKLNQKL
ncbi:hypothetical protein H0I23_07995 [Cellulophaga sp. HaHaR_3_176]|uniref:hypothetical protein n=1 Tax=Cellulophaga sp. HaHaR_3_176 TaxID=1942464 RepID=UPI001C1F7B31|nr:hypothetical protein [Cellulophaga sp. HaHaR_3_176]QWX85569.1 hypothetical protein H0I23_07995 [Cellulophaga sp. HaHaR_3_176]